MEAEGRKTKSIRQEFTKFIQTITKGVFLCVEGYFMDPEKEEEEEDIEEMSSYRSFELE